MPNTRGPTRTALQSQCVVEPVESTRNLQGYFNAVKQLLFQGEAYYMEGSLVQVRKVDLFLCYYVCC